MADDDFGFDFGEPKSTPWWRQLFSVLVIGGVIAAVAILAFLFSPQPQPARSADGCLSGVRSGAIDSTATHHLLLVDRSNVLDGQQVEDVRVIAEEEVSRMSLNDRFSIYAVNPDSNAQPALLMSFCSPVQPLDGFARFREELVGNRKAREAELLAFQDEASRRVGELGQGDNLTSTSIIGDLNAISDYRVFSRYASRRLTIYSDMIENSRLQNQYGGVTPYKTFKSATGFKPPRLKGAEILIIYRRTDDRVQGKEHQAFWRDFFTDAGAKTVTFEPDYLE